MITKEWLRKHIEQLPDEMTIDELMERILFFEKIEQGLSDIEGGKVVSESELEEKMSKW